MRTTKIQTITDDYENDLAVVEKESCSLVMDSVQRQLLYLEKRQLERLIRSLKALIEN
jgi:hypothetical protein